MVRWVVPWRLAKSSQRFLLKLCHWGIACSEQHGQEVCAYVCAGSPPHPPHLQSWCEKVLQKSQDGMQWSQLLLILDQVLNFFFFFSILYFFSSFFFFSNCDKQCWLVGLGDLAGLISFAIQEQWYAIHLSLMLSVRVWFIFSKLLATKD